MVGMVAKYFPESAGSALFGIKLNLLFFKSHLLLTISAFFAGLSLGHSWVQSQIQASFAVLIFVKSIAQSFTLQKQVTWKQ